MRFSSAESLVDPPGQERTDDRQHLFPQHMSGPDAGGGMTAATLTGPVPRWARWAAHAVPLLMLPSGLWRIALGVGQCAVGKPYRAACSGSLGSTWRMPASARRLLTSFSRSRTSRASSSVTRPRCGLPACSMVP